MTTALKTKLLAIATDIASIQAQTAKPEVDKVFVLYFNLKEDFLEKMRTCGY